MREPLLSGNIHLHFIDRYLIFQRPNKVLCANLSGKDQSLLLPIDELLARIDPYVELRVVLSYWANDIDYNVM